MVRYPVLHQRKIIGRYPQKVDGNITTTWITDCLFNSLKHEYLKDNIFTMEKVLETLIVSLWVTVVIVLPDDFWDYNGLLNDTYGKSLAR